MSVLNSTVIRFTAIILIGFVLGGAALIFAEDAGNDNRNLDFKGTININTATKDELQRLYNIGAKKARAIVKYRKRIVKFENISQLKNVKGIGDSTFDMIKSHISVDKPTNVGS